MSRLSDEQYYEAIESGWSSADMFVDIDDEVHTINCTCPECIE